MHVMISSFFALNLIRLTQATSCNRLFPCDPKSTSWELSLWRQYRKHIAWMACLFPCDLAVELGTWAGHIVKQSAATGKICLGGGGEETYIWERQLGGGYIWRWGRGEVGAGTPRNLRAFHWSSRSGRAGRWSVG